jgi:hypothetical protein
VLVYVRMALVYERRVLVYVRTVLVQERNLLLYIRMVPLCGNCVLLSHYAGISGKSVPTFQNTLSVPSSRVTNFGYLTLEDGTDRLS